MPKKQSTMLKLAEQIARQIIREQTPARLAMGEDAALIAAHRVFGMGPKRAKAFDKEYGDALNWLAGLFVLDSDENRDKTLTYAKAKRDELISSIVGPELFVPFDKLYGEAYMDETIRIRVRSEKDAI